MSDVERATAPEDYAEQGTDRQPHSRWSWENWGMRLVYAVLAGTVVNVATGIYALGTVVAVMLFVLTTAIVVVRRR